MTMQNPKIFKIYSFLILICHFDFCILIFAFQNPEFLLLLNSFNISADISEALIQPFISPVNLINVINFRLSVSN